MIVLVIVDIVVDVATVAVTITVAGRVAFIVRVAVQIVPIHLISCVISIVDDVVSWLVLPILIPRVTLAMMTGGKPVVVAVMVMTTMMFDIVVSSTGVVVGERRQFASSATPSARASANVDADAMPSIETRQMPAGRHGAELTRGAEEARVAMTGAGIDALAVAMASVGAGRRGAVISSPPDGTSAFMRRHALTTSDAATAGTHRRQALRAGESLRTTAAVAAHAPAAVEARRGANRATVGAGVVAERAGALSGPGAATAVETRRIAEEVLAAPTRVAVGTNAAHGGVPAKSTVEAVQVALFRRQPL